MTQLIDDGIQASIFTAAHTPAEVRGGLKAAGATGGGGVIPKSVTRRESLKILKPDWSSLLAPRRGPIPRSLSCGAL